MDRMNERILELRHKDAETKKAAQMVWARKDLPFGLSNKLGEFLMDENGHGQFPVVDWNVDGAKRMKELLLKMLIGMEPLTRDEGNEWVLLLDRFTTSRYLWVERSVLMRDGVFLIVYEEKMEEERLYSTVPDSGIMAMFANVYLCSSFVCMTRSDDDGQRDEKGVLLHFAKSEKGLFNLVDSMSGRYGFGYVLDVGGENATARKGLLTFQFTGYRSFSSFVWKGQVFYPGSTLRIMFPCNSVEDMFYMYKLQNDRYGWNRRRETIEYFNERKQVYSAYLWASIKSKWERLSSLFIETGTSSSSKRLKTDAKVCASCGKKVRGYEGKI